MEDSASMLKQLKIIKWFLGLIMMGVLTAAGTVAYFSYVFFEMAGSSLTENGCEEESFRDKVSSLVDKGKLEEAVNLTHERIKTHPNDEDAYWYRGVSYYLQGKWQLAVADFNKVETLAPSWKAQYVEPYRTAALAKQKSSDELSR